MISLQSDLDRITKEASKLRVELQKSKVNHEELSEEYETLKETYEDQMSLINKYELEIDKKNNIINDNTKVIYIYHKLYLIIQITIKLTISFFFLYGIIQ